MYVVFKSKIIIVVRGGRVDDGCNRRKTLDKKIKRLIY